MPYDDVGDWIGEKPDNPNAYDDWRARRDDELLRRGELELIGKRVWFVKGTVILDFDGTVHLYSSGWQGANLIPDPPTSGAREAIAKLREKYKVVIVSSRCNQPGGMSAIWDWLRMHEITVDDVCAEKPPHLVVVDDRALRFDGNWDNVLANVETAAIPWNKKEARP